MKQIFKPLYIFFTLSLLLLLAACNKDKGNYTYHMPEEPTIKMDSVFNVFVGDSLIIEPIVSMKEKADLLLTWVISVPDPNQKDLIDTGFRFNKVFGLGPSTYTGHVTISNFTNGMKYVHYFVVNGQTAFVKGTTVLSLENGVTQLTFIKPDGTVQPRIYEAVNPGEQLPPLPSQLLVTHQAYQPPVKSYWIIGKDASNPGIQVDANTFRKMKTLGDNFFDEPKPIQPSKIFVNPLGVISGVINDKLYLGTTNTWDQAPTYGMFGLATEGDYELSPELLYNFPGTNGPGTFLGFDKNRKQFVRFNNYGGAIYFGPAYAVKPGTAFDPTNLGMSLEHIQQINGGLGYAFCRDASNILYELKFNTNFDGPFEFDAIHKRVFSKPELLTAATLWQSTTNELIYFTSGDKIYKYNPTNLDFKVLDVNLTGKTITMIKVLEDEQTMVVGVDGTLYYLDISTGKNGNILKTITGIPGTPIDMGVRTI